LINRQILIPVKTSLFKNIFSHLAIASFVLCFTFTGYATQNQILTGADQSDLYLYKLKGKNLALVVNQTSRIGEKHLVDFLLEKKMTIKRIFAPEHGFRGEAGAGELIANTKDPQTGIPIISLYGKNRKASADQLSGIDIVIFDIQDVGCRFYTYISTLHLMMEACAQNNITLLILDRPNPNGDYFDGPVLQPAFKSFVGMDPIPVVHGCTVAELAQMINGEGWLDKGIKVKLDIIKVANYTHSTMYDPPVKPSPNLPNYFAIRIYPSFCFFEATSVSVGRGTQFPFQVLGYPDPSFGRFSFTPQSIKGMELYPTQKNKKCFGQDFRGLKEIPKFTLSYFIEWFNKFKNKDEFLTQIKGFNQLMGNDTVLALIREGKGETEIRNSWKIELANYGAIRKKYLLYPDFNSAQ